MAVSYSILVVDDNRSILTSLQFLLGDYFAHVLSLSSPQGILALLEREEVDVVLLDMNFSAGINNGNEGLFWLQELKAHFPNLPVVLFTAYADIELAVEGLKRGAADFVVKPWDNKKMVQVLLAVCGQNKKKNDPECEVPRTMYWGESEAMRRLRTLVERCSVTHANVLITGENGTGKEMLAREIHTLSPRHAAPMVSVDMGAITDTLFESELFGHVKGAFTDARQDRVGRFEAAHGGTLFFDEIGNLPLYLQAKLLTAVQNRQIVRVGSNQPVGVDIRLICATNRDLQEMVVRNEFREDLLYRINTIHLHLPPLRERKEDILPLAYRFLKSYSQMYHRRFDGFTGEAEVRLMAHPWYGNIRELQHTLERAVILCGECENGKLPAPVLHLADDERRSGEAEEQVRTLEEMEMSAIRQALEQCRGNYSLAASRLGISRQTLYNKIKRYGL